MTVHNQEDAGAISARGRFERMEAALERIEAKLDSKADQVSLTSVETRVGALELVNSNRVAVETATRRQGDDRYRILMLAVGFLTIINVGLGIALTLVAMMPSGAPT